MERNVKYEQIPFEGKEVSIMFRWFEADGYRANLAALEREFGLPTDSNHTFERTTGHRSPLKRKLRAGLQKVSMAKRSRRF